MTAVDEVVGRYTISLLYPTHWIAKIGAFVHSWRNVGCGVIQLTGNVMEVNAYCEFMFHCYCEQPTQSSSASANRHTEQCETDTAMFSVWTYDADKPHALQTVTRIGRRNEWVMFVWRGSTFNLNNFSFSRGFALLASTLISCTSVRLLSRFREL